MTKEVDQKKKYENYNKIVEIILRMNVKYLLEIKHEKIYEYLLLI